MMDLLGSDVFKKYVEFVEKPHGDEYPIVYFEPNINLEENKELKTLAQGNKSLRLYSSLGNAVHFVDKTPLGIILIFSSNQNEEKLIKSFHVSQFQSYRRMFDIEEEMLLKDIFKGISDQTRNSLKAFIFVPITDVLVESPVNPDEEEVMVMCEIKDMVKDFQQEYVVIWYDPGASPEDKEILAKEVDIEPKNIYIDFNDLYQRIHEPNGIPYHLIMTNRNEAQKILKEMNDELKDSLLSLYIYGDDPDIAKIKKRKVFTGKKMEDLIPNIKKGIRSNSRLVHSFPAFATDFDASDRNSIFNLHYYLRGLINFNNQKQAKADFVNLAQRIYESKKLFEFKDSYNDYNKEEIFKWYAVESPVYKLVNNCLRIATSDSILYCRFVLKHLEEAIQEDYNSQSYKINGMVYRGAYISQGEWAKLGENVGKEIEMYGFLSTSQNLEVAKNFVCSDSQNKILISIIIPPLPNSYLNEQGYANISKNSGFQEAEILFNIRSKFRILETGTFALNNSGGQCRHLVLLYGPQLLRKQMTHKKPTLNIELELPLDLRCDSCQTKSKLFTFRLAAVEVYCLDCLLAKGLPEDIPLLALELPNPRKIMKKVNGTILNFSEKTGLSYYGYKCKDCQGAGKNRYLTWKNLNTGEINRQCLECFQNRKKMESHLLIFESHPYKFWTEHQAAWETIHSDYQQRLSGEKHSLSQPEVYMETQEFGLCIEYEKKNIEKLKRKRKRELEKILSFTHMAKAYEKLKRNKEALDYFQKIWDISTQFFGKKDQRTATALQNLAFAYESAKEYQKSKEYSEKALQFLISSHEREDSNLGIAYNNLASVCKTLGEHKKALENHRKALEIIKRVDGERHPNIAMSYHNIASVYEDVGNWKEAGKYYQKAFDIRESIYGEKHIMTATSYNNLGIVYEKMGEHNKALKYFMKAVEILIPIYGINHPQIATSLNNIGGAYKSLHDHQKAEEYYMKALEMAKALYGEKESEISAISYGGLGSICTDLKQHDQAKEYLLKALGIVKSIFGEKNQRTALMYNNLGAAHLDLHEYSKAKEVFSKALEITESMYGENHPNNFNSYNLLAGVYGDLKDQERALHCSLKALEIAKSIYGEEHLVTAVAYNNIGFRYTEFKKDKEAKFYFEKALDIRKLLLGEDHFELASLYDNLGNVEMNLGKFQKAREHFKEALRIKELNFQENHLSIAESYIWFAILSTDSGDYKQASENYKKALGIRKSLLPEGHPLIISLEQKIASTSKELGKKEKI